MRAIVRIGSTAAAALALLAPSTAAAADAQERAVARGVVFNDENGNGKRDASEGGLGGVRVSNGSDVVATDAEGRYELPVSDDTIVFVIKPRDWATPVDGLNLPRFWYVHKPAGSPKLEFAGVAPTGPLPASIDFPLRSAPEQDRFDVLVFGDPQPRDLAEVNYLSNDVVREVIGIDAAFGVSLGDIVFDNLGLYDAYNEVVSQIGIPWHNVYGNHDQNYDVTSDPLADETWERVYGPPTYSFDRGDAHFIVIDGVMYDGGKKRGKYHAEFGRHLAFIENDLKLVPKDKLVVLMMHIPPIEAVDKAAYLKLFEDRPHTLSLAAHWHKQQHFFLGEKDGWHGAQPHHLVVQATSCGSWWQGAPDELGIPHTTMRDGGPNGWSILSIDGNRYRIRFQAARRGPDAQMNIYLPDELTRDQLASSELVVNVFAGSERSTVEYRVGRESENWASMRREERADPAFEAMKRQEESQTPPPGRKLPKAEPSGHIWVARLPSDLPPGPHTVEVRTVDMFGQTYVDRKVVRVR